jgi:hypothetical protein
MDVIDSLHIHWISLFLKCRHNESTALSGRLLPLAVNSSQMLEARDSFIPISPCSVLTEVSISTLATRSVWCTVVTHRSRRTEIRRVGVDTPSIRYPKLF